MSEKVTLTAFIITLIFAGLSLISAVLSFVIKPYIDTLLQFCCIGFTISGFITICLTTGN